MNIQCGSQGSQFLANTLMMEVYLYEEGILRVKMVDDWKEGSRFGISDIGVGVEEANLNRIKDISSLISGDQSQQLNISYLSSDTLDHYEYTIQYSPFRIIQKINDQLVTIVNHRDTLYFENTKYFNRDNPAIIPN